MGFYSFAPLPVSGSLITPPIALTGAATTTQLVDTQVTGDTNPRVVLLGGGIGFGNGTVAATTVFMQYGGAGVTQFNGKVVGQNAIDVAQAGFGLQVAEGSNAKQGTFALSGAATTVVANTSVTANSRILLTTQALGTVTAASTLAVSARTAGTSFTVTPSQATDTSTIAFEIFEPG